MGFAECGANVRIYDGARIIGAEFISIGDNVIIDDFVMIQARVPSVIGSHVHIASFASITGGGRFVLSDFCGLSSGVRLLTGSEDFLGGGLTNPTIPPEFRDVRREGVVLGRHAIVGANAVVLPGVTVGAGAAVAAGSVVNRALDDWAIYAGAPARRVKARMQETILAAEQALHEKSPFKRHL